MSINKSFAIILCGALLLPLMLLASAPLLGAELWFEYSLVARSGVTPIPAGVGAFTGFGSAPAIDADGNVVFTGAGGLASGKTQSGVYTQVGACCQKVADRNTLVPGGGGVTFDNFYGADKNDIDGGRVAFRADSSASGTLLGVYSNVGQTSPNSLVALAIEDGVEWSATSFPWVDGEFVAMRGQRLIPQEHTSILVWDGAYLTDDFLDPGVGYQIATNTQASISGDAAIFRRYKTGSSELVIANGGQYEVLAVVNVTPMPGPDGGTFGNFSFYPVVDRGGVDAAFTGNGTTGRGVYKRVNGGALQEVADTATQLPGATPGWVFSFFPEAGVALANGKVAFWGQGPSFTNGIYTDVGGALAVVVDNLNNNTINLNGQTERITDLTLNHKSFAYTPHGYEVVFWASLESGGYAIIRARINDGSGTFTVHKDFSNNSTASVSVTASCTSGTVTNSPQLAREGVPAVFNITGALQGVTCTANEPTVPSGYTRNQADCQNGDPLWGSCTIINTLNTGSFTVNKDFSDNSTASVSVTAACTSGTVTNSPQLAREGLPAVFNVSGAVAGTTCTANEPTVPAGYTKNQTDCQNGDPLGGSCTIVNTKNAHSFTVYKDFSDNNTASVSITATCNSGTVTNNPQLAREGAPAIFNISGATTGATCTATEPTVPAGYTRNQTDCQNGDPLNGSCTITNTLNTVSGTFTVNKDFSDNNAASVSVTASCSSGTVTNSPQLAREGAPAVFTVSGALTGATCTANEPTVPVGYTKNQTDCQNGDPLNGSCTIVNTLNTTSGTFTVNKDFSDNSTASVSVTASCSSGTVTNNPQLAREGVPAVFNITGALAGATCTATEPTVPSGYTRNQTDCQSAKPLNGSCTIVNTLNTTSSTFTVYKDFSNNSTASVSVTASCSSGTVTNNPQTAREGVPAVFNITGALAGATCTATEPTVPVGYARNQADCQSAKPLNGSCIIVNTLIPTPQQQTVFNEDFEDGNATGWSTTGTVDVSGDVRIGQFALRLQSSSNAERTISTAGFSAVSVAMRLAATALEKDDSCFAEVSTNGGSSWSTIVQVSDGNDSGTFFANTVSPAGADNNPNLRVRFRSTGGQSSDYCWGDEVAVLGTPSAGGAAGSFLVRKDFSDNNAASVTVSLSCTSGTVTNSPRTASEASPAIFYIQGQSAGATCSASETVPSGYTASQSGCQDGDPVNGSCAIVNTLNPTSSGTFTVYKDFSDNNTASVSVTASCSSGTVTNSPQNAREGVPAVFNITGALAGATCTATEPTVPAGYTRNQTDCQTAKPLNGSCTIVNTKNSHSFTVNKDFSDNNAASVSVTLTCTSGTVTNSPRLASEGAPAVFTISGATTGATCTAVENPVPTGYTANQTDCQNGDPLNGSCIIVNTAETVIHVSNFETGQATGWTLSGNATIDSGKAIGQYSLRHSDKGAASTRTVSTAGYTGVRITMNLAGESLEGGESCVAELSTNGGSSWSPVVTVNDGADTGAFDVATVSPAAASNNANLRLRTRVVSNNKDDRCWSDDIRVVGTASGSGTAAQSVDTKSQATLAAVSDDGESASTIGARPASDAGAAVIGGFDPGFDHLFGDGNVERQLLSYELLMNGEALNGPVDRSAYMVPAGAAMPEHVFDGWLEVHGTAGLDTAGLALPDLNVRLVQFGNHLFPLGRDAVAGTVDGWDYIIDTGRVWRESGDHGLSRASLPFQLVRPGTDCAQDGVLTFLFSDDGATSKAAYQVSGGGCGSAMSDHWGMLDAVYSPARLDASALGIETVLACAADNWLPLVQGRGGISLLLLENGAINYVLRDGENLLWLDAKQPSAAIGGLCD